MKELEKGALGKVERVGGVILNGLRDIVADCNVKAVVQGYPSVFQIFFTNGDKVRSYRDFLKVDFVKFQKFAREALRRKLWLWPAAGGHMFVSAAHTTEDADRALEAFKEILPLIP